MKKTIMFLVTVTSMLSAPVFIPVYAQTYTQTIASAQSDAIVSSMIPVLASITNQVSTISSDYAQDQVWISTAESGLASIATGLQDLGTLPMNTDADRQIVSQRVQAASSNIGVIQTQLQAILEKRRQQTTILALVLEKLRLLTVLLSQ